MELHCKNSRQFQFAISSQLAFVVDGYFFTDTNNVSTSLAEGDMSIVTSLPNGGNTKLCTFGAKN
jgi:hypothetical protein